jgi:hypothetical protein
LILNTQNLLFLFLDIQVPTGVSEGVIRDIYKIMLPHASKLFPTDFVFKCAIANLPTI